jgi:hypothetical protein
MLGVDATALTEIAAGGVIIIKRDERGHQLELITPQPSVPNPGLNIERSATHLIDTRLNPVRGAGGLLDNGNDAVIDLSRFHEGIAEPTGLTILIVIAV